MGYDQISLFIFGVMLAAFGHDIGKTTSQFFAVIDVQKLIGAVGVGEGAKNSCDHKWSVRPYFLKHAHEGNRTSHAKTAHIILEKYVRSLLDCILEILLVIGSIPSRGSS